MNAEILEKLASCDGEPAKMRAALSEYIVSLGVEPSEQYVAVLEYLYLHGTHPSADEIHTALSPEYPDLSGTMVHTILDMLARSGAIRTIRLDRYNTFYDANTFPHPHFICEECGQITDLEFPYRVCSEILPPAGSVVHEARLHYIGICPQCNKKYIS